MYDNRLNDRAINTLKACPVIFLGMTYWYLGNRQAFFNKYTLIEIAYGEMKDPQHSLFDYVEGPNHTIPLLIFIPVAIFYKSFIRGMTKLFECCKILNMSSYRKVTT